MSWLPESMTDFGTAALAALIVGVYLVFGEPFVGWILHRRFEAAVHLVPTARRWLYRRLLVLEWGLVSLVLGIVMVAPEIGWSELGLRWPDQMGAFSAAAVVIVLAVSYLSVRTLRTGALREVRADSPTLRSVGALLPRTDVERQLFGAVALTAGIAEEIVYRGFGIALLAALGPALPWWALIGLAGAGFGLAHAYQGVAGALSTAVLGAVLAAVYLDTGSLLLPIVLHALIDLRFLAVPTAALPHPASSPTARPPSTRMPSGTAEAASPRTPASTSAGSGETESSAVPVVEKPASGLLQPTSQQPSVQAPIAQEPTAPGPDGQGPSEQQPHSETAATDVPTPAPQGWASDQAIHHDTRPIEPGMHP